MASSDTIALAPHLRSDRQIHVIISTLSGDQSAQAYFENTLQPLLTTHSIPHIVHTTTSHRSIIDLTSTTILTAATKGAKTTILLLSGDGGVIDILSTLSTLLMRDTNDSRVGSIFIKPVLALFPCGTANALAHSTNIAADPIKTLLTGRARPLPQFEATFSPGSTLVSHNSPNEEIGLNHDGDAATLYGAVVFSWGLHASLVAESDTPEMRKHGIDRFKMTAQQLLSEAHRYQGLVKVRAERTGEWENFSYPSLSLATDPAKEHAYILCPLVARLEEKFHISPATTPLSSTLRLVAIDPVKGPEEVMRVLGLAYQDGAHVGEESVTYRELDALRIEFDEDDARWRKVCVDGKIVEVPKGGWAEVRVLPGVGMDGRRVVEVVAPA